MYNWAAGLAEQYPFVVTETAKGRGAFLLFTEEGRKMVREYHGSEERAEILWSVMEFLKKEDFLSETLYRTKEGTFVSKDPEEGRYLCKDWLEGKECDTRSREEILAATVRLADLHNVVSRYPGELKEPVLRPEDSLLREYEKHNRELIKVRNYIHSLKKKSDFEMEYLNRFQEFGEQAGKALEGIRGLYEGEKRQEIRKLLGLCHGDYTHHNILFTRQGMAVVNFEQLYYGFQVEDLVHFMRKMLEKHGWDMKLGCDMIKAYNEIRPLGAIGEEMLYLLLSYPEKYWKIGNRYYNVRKSWISLRNREKLDKFLKQEENRKQFLQAFYLNLAGGHV